MATPNYMKEKLNIGDVAEKQIRSESLEMTLIHRLMDKNGWDFPSSGDDCTDYDTAVKDVKWFIEQLLDLAGLKTRTREENVR